MHRLLTGALAVALVTGCRSTPQMPVQLQGDPASLARLAGAWTGQYWGGAGGRGGSLSFALRSGTDSLYGDVTMIDSRGQQIRAADQTGEHAMHARSPQHLRIDFVAIRADSIRGVLEPYVVPVHREHDVPRPGACERDQGHVPDAQRRTSAGRGRVGDEAFRRREVNGVRGPRRTPSRRGG
jgi:hypothetical protein